MDGAANADGPPSGLGSKGLEPATRALDHPRVRFGRSISIIQHIEIRVGSPCATELLCAAVGIE
jgi:hypothetical protein